MTLLAHERTRLELLRAHAPALLPGLLGVALMVTWAIQNGGYDASTWYWGALVLLAILTAVMLMPGRRRLHVSRATSLALAFLTLYVAWSYLSIAWSQYPGDALTGSNRALLYLLLFALLALLPWTVEAALAALVTFALGVGGIAIVMLFRLAAADHVQQLVVSGRLLAPTGYFNGNVALFMMAALIAVALAARGGTPGLLRGALIATAAADLQLVVIGQSRGWLFTLPLVLIAACVVVRDRIKVALAALLPIAATLVPLHRLLGIYHSYVNHTSLDDAARSAGRIAILSCAATFLVATMIAWAEMLVRPRTLSVRARRLIGTALALLAIAGGYVGAVVATHHRPVAFIERQWKGFTSPASSRSSTSYFAAVGSGRYDFWRVSLKGAFAHPVGGLGQDNFADYYITRRRTNEEPQWPHSLELRLLVHTGIVGLLLFAGFLIAATAAAVQARRSGSGLARSVAGAAMLPMVVWLVHGSVDWFWELPALSGPALGFLAMAGALSPQRLGRAEPAGTRGALLPAAGFAAAAVAVACAVVVLAFPYLSARELTAASDAQARDPAAALRNLDNAAKLDPLSADPGRLGGWIALKAGQFSAAELRFSQAISREPGGWFAWLGDGLAASQLGQLARARRDFKVAAAINSRQPVTARALARVYSGHPLTPVQAQQLLAMRG